jgi:hypothetical protein
VEVTVKVASSPGEKRTAERFAASLSINFRPHGLTNFLAIAVGIFRVSHLTLLHFHALR